MSIDDKGISSIRQIVLSVRREQLSKDRIIEPQSEKVES